MSAIQALIQELDQEAKTTRRVLERVPGDRLTWKPHDKSMSLGQLALHVATVPGAVAEMSRKSPVAVPQFIHPSAASVSELIPALDESVAKARQILSTMNDEALAEIWRVTEEGDEVELRGTVAVGVAAGDQAAPAGAARAGGDERPVEAEALLRQPGIVVV